MPHRRENYFRKLIDMLISLQPKQLFQKDVDATKAFRDAIDSPAFKVGVHNAIAEFVLKSKPTTEELEGVRRFLEMLINFGEKEDPTPRSPIMQSIDTYRPQPKPK